MPRVPATSKVSDAVLDALSRAEVTGNLLRMPQLERADYIAMNKVLGALGGKWTRKVQAHVFGEHVDVRARVEAVVLTGDFVDPKANDVFVTPDDLADDLVRRALRGRAEALAGTGLRFLEPSAGTGALAHALVAASPSADATLIELLPNNVRALCGAFPGARVIEGDFLSQRPDQLGRFDVIVMNPPFSRQQDIDHAQHAFEFSAPGGVLVSVMSAGTTFRTNRKATDFRAWLDAAGGTFEDLPDGSFASSGTNVRTVVATVRR